MRELLASFAHPGTVEWIGLRTARRADVRSVESASAEVIDGLVGDRFRGGANAKRQITLIQREHLEAVGRLLKFEAAISPEKVRRNIVVSGLNLQALKNHHFKIGDAVLSATGNCAPCSRMEEVLGTGGYNAMRGHGGITAFVVSPGFIRVGDSVSMLKAGDGLKANN